MTEGSTPPPQNNESLQLLIDKLSDADRVLYNETMLRSMKGERTDVTNFSADLNAALLGSGALCEIPFESEQPGRAGEMATESRSQVGVMIAPGTLTPETAEAIQNCGDGELVSIHTAGEMEAKLRPRIIELERELEITEGKLQFYARRRQDLELKCQLVKPEVADLVDLVKTGIHGRRATNTKMGPVYTIVVPEKVAMAIDGQAYVLRAIMGEANDCRPEEVQSQPASVDKV